MTRVVRALALAASGLLAPLTLLVPLTAAAQAGDPPGRVPQPVLTGDFPDPTLATWRGRWVSVATGSMAPRAVAPAPGGPWRRVPAALAFLPPWAVDDAIWATDLVRVGGRWRLYFSAPAAGLPPGGRCIGVAVAPTPLAGFRPDPAPLVCPAAGATPYAAGVDLVVAPGSALPAGVIDPDLHHALDGSLLLTYRTQGTPSSIRVVPLDPTGRRATQPVSTTLVVSSGVVENPLLVERGATWVLVTSEGYFGSCDYRTTVQRAPSLDLLAAAPRESLARRGTTGLCGPGGADIDGRTMVLHAWTCPVGRPTCRVATRPRQHGPRFAAKRSLYVATLRWGADGSPRITGYLGPRTGLVSVAHRDPVRQTGPHPVPTGAGDALPATTPLGPELPDPLTLRLRDGTG